MARRARPNASARSPAAALADSFDACVEVQRAALAATPADVLVGSSWGGAVAATLLADGSWSGPTLLLCPALRALDKWVGGCNGWPELASEGGGYAQLAALPAATKEACLIVHGKAVQVDIRLTLG